jgi:hypothetical protein
MERGDEEAWTWSGGVIGGVGGMVACLSFLFILNQTLMTTGWGEKEESHLERNGLHCKSTLGLLDG